MSSNNIQKTTRKALWLVIFLFAFANTFAQEIPNGDGDLLWKVKPADGNGLDAIAIHPINSNIMIGKWNKIFEYDVNNGNQCVKLYVIQIAR